jgi:hypothetical protein
VVDASLLSRSSSHVLITYTMVSSVNLMLHNDVQAKRVSLRV